MYLPYRSKSFFYGEYEYVCKIRNDVNQGKFSTFKRAFAKVVVDKKEKDGIDVKLSGGKGHFDKCDICHSADQLLNKSMHWTRAEKDIILMYRRRHIAQQFAERVKLRQNIASTYDVDDNGQPEVALLFTDGMTISRGRQPLLFLT